MELTRDIRDKRVAIARDIIDQLAREDVPMVVSTGNYVVSRDSTPLRLSMNDDLKDHVDKVQKTCEVCMLGACLLSKARLYNEVPISGISHSGNYIRVGSDGTRRLLSTVFDDVTLDRLEVAFECNVSVAEDVEDEFNRGAEAFEMSFSNPHDRAKAIAENLITNDGEFIVKPVASLYEDDEDDEEDDLYDMDDEDDDGDDDEDWEDDEDEDKEDPDEKE